MPDRLDALPTLYGGITHRRVTPRDLQRAKDRDERWAMLTSYDSITAALFEEAGLPVLLVGDSAANVVLGYPTTVPVTVDELLPLVRAVVRSTTRPLVVADLPFGSYQASPEQALGTAVRFLKDGGAHAVKLEGGVRVAAHVELLVQSGVAVMGHIGLTPQSELVMGRRVQGRGDSAQALVDDALALQAAGAFSVVLEGVPAALAERITKELTVPTIGIGAGAACDAQVLVWTDMAGLTPGAPLTFVKRYADLRGALADAVRTYADEVREGVFPGPEHSFGD
jgi:3-methyl-2-oxobutanoate hydroxymethyltransferase